MKQIARAYSWLLLAPVLLPLVIWKGLIYPYLVPKTLLFYAVTLVVAALFVLLVAHRHAFYWGRISRWEACVPALLLVLAYATSFIGIDFYRSFWSTFVRGDGLLMLTCVVAYFYFILLSAEQKFLERLLRAVAAVGSFVAVYGIVEWLIDGERIGGLLGNAAFFAGYLGISLFVTLAAMPALSRGWRQAAQIGAALQFIAIILSATRGTIVALVIAGMLYLVYLAVAKKGSHHLWAIRMLAAVLLIGGLLFAFRGELAKVPFMPLARVASISSGDSNVANRLFVWKNMVVQIEQHPWVGVGAEHIDSLFNSFYDPVHISEQWFDRSHNAFLDYAAQYGVGGLLLYLALIASFFSTAKRLLRVDERRAVTIALLAIVYAIQNFFVFDTVSSFWLLLALLAAFIAVSEKEIPQKACVIPEGIRPVSWVIALVLVLLIIPVSVRPAQAAYNLAAAYTYQVADVAKEVKYLSRGIALGTYGDLEYGYESYDMYANNQAPALTGQARSIAYQAALSILTTDFNRYPYDARTALYLAHVLTLAPQDVTVDNELLSTALERTIRLSPRRSQPWYILVNLSISDANRHAPGSKERVAGYTAAHDLLSRYITLVPGLSEPYFVRAQLEYAKGDVSAASADAARGKDLYTGDLGVAERAASYYETVLDLQNAAFFLEEIMRLDPDNAASKSDLEKIRAYESKR